MKTRRNEIIIATLSYIPKKELKEKVNFLKPYIKKNHGIYTLYNEDELYYIGKTSRSLASRLEQHLKDKHKNKWTHFSVYLTKKKRDVHDIEAVMICVAQPKGNSQKKQYLVLGEDLNEVLKKQHKNQISQLSKYKVNKNPRYNKNKKVKSKRAAPVSLNDLPDKCLPKSIIATYRGEPHQATLLESREVKYFDQKYDKLHDITKMIITKKKGRPSSWFFWKVLLKNNQKITLKDYILKRKQ